MLLYREELALITGKRELLVNLIKQEEALYQHQGQVCSLLAVL